MVEIILQKFRGALRAPVEIIFGWNCVLGRSVSITIQFRRPNSVSGNSLKFQHYFAVQIAILRIYWNFNIISPSKLSLEIFSSISTLFRRPNCILVRCFIIPILFRRPNCILINFALFQHYFDCPNSNLDRFIEYFNTISPSKLCV